ncbi:hypothetical protein HK104_003473 [Borealophlyctis nickersoniae]|nr:hypothetical protein HK104_003473 [Borealophlyctis nickersoniae]
MKSSLLAWAAGALCAAATVAAQNPLEPPNGKMYFGAWYDRLQNDTPVAINSRLGYKPLSFFQSDINLTSTLQLPTEFDQQVDATGTDAILYLTVYPIQGFDVVTDSAVADLAKEVKSLCDKGRRVFIRYASEMNGAWFAYGQQPTKFLKSWKQVVDTIRTAIGAAHRSMVAFVWAPNSSNGYPFATLEFSITKNSSDFPLLDTAKNGNLSQADPYSPYYPGDDYVDWVGFSAYHYGAEYPWEQNVLPLPGQIEAMVKGQRPWGTGYNIYDMFCGDGKTGRLSPKSTAGGKPFMITETGATYHLAIKGQTTPPPPGPGRAAIKQAWWRQFMNQTFIRTFPKIKATCTFEFQKFEETTWRDFTTLGPYQGTFDVFTNKPSTEDAPVLQSFKDDLPNFADMIVWANKSDLIKPNSTGNGSDSKPATGGAVNSVGFGGMAGAVVAAAVGGAVFGLL